MRFQLIDRIVDVQPGRSLRAFKNLTSGEEYLADHFPGFPVMPGVLMLETLVEAGAWLLRLTDDFRDSVIVLREAKNVKYGTFMEPGRRMNIEVELLERNGPLATLKGKGAVDDQSTVTARIVLACSNLRDRDPKLQPADDRLMKHWRSCCEVLQLPSGTA